MDIPSEFVERLEQEFGKKYRVRWSSAKHEFHIEQKVRRGLAEGQVNVKPRHARQRHLNEDNLIRARDGYVLTMAIKPGTFTYCLDCNTKFSVPAFTTAAVSCPFCLSRGKHRYQIAGYFPLSDSLIDHLRKIDSERGGLERLDEDINRQNDLLLQEQNLNLRRHIESATRERFNRLVGINQWGYSGANKFVHRTRY